MYSKQPHEIGELSKKTMNRTVALAALVCFVSCVVLAYMGVIEFRGPVMTSCIASGCIASLVVLSSRTSYLPFLGEAVFPSSLLKDTMTPADATVDIDVVASPGATHVAFWASEPNSSGVVKNPWKAYGSYTNSGIARVESNGHATIRIRCPSRYAIRGKVLPRHVHYRDVYPSGILGEIKTAQVVCA